jgi:branched-chain amino acid transport system permease protein
MPPRTACPSRFVLLLLSLWALALGACERLDIEQLRDCERVIPALEEPGRRIAVLRGERDPAAAHAVIVHYRVHDGPEGPEIHWVSCRFGGGGLEVERRILTAVVTDREGALSEVQLEILRRFWLGSLEAQAGVLQTVVPDRTSPFVRLLYFLQTVINALVVCSVYGLLAVAYTLVYAIIGRINLAFGELSMIAAFTAWLAIVLFAAAGGLALPLALLAALLLAVAATAVHGWAIERFVFRPLRGRASQAALIATIGLAIFLQESVRLARGAGDRWLHPVFSETYPIAEAAGFPVAISAAQIIVVLLVAGIYALHWGFVERSGFGLAWRSCAQDGGMAALCGINVDRTAGLTFALGGAYAAVAGFVVALYYGGVSFHMGALLGFKALTAAVVGGIGSVPGAMLGGILIGLFETFWSAYLTIAYRDVAVFALLAIVLALRPEGLLGLGKVSFLAGQKPLSQGTVNRAGE